MTPEEKQRSHQEKQGNRGSRGSSSRHQLSDRRFDSKDVERLMKRYRVTRRR